MNQDVADDKHESESFAELGEISEHTRSLIQSSSSTMYKKKKVRSETTIRFPNKEINGKRFDQNSNRVDLPHVPENSCRRSIKSEIVTTDLVDAAEPGAGDYYLVVILSVLLLLDLLTTHE